MRGGVTKFHFGLKIDFKIMHNAPNLTSSFARAHFLLLAKEN